MGNNAIDSLFGSKTRVKLLSLFLNNPNEAYYVREITRIIDEQVNSVRRELSNLSSIDIVKSTTKDRKLYYSTNQRHKYYIPLRAVFADETLEGATLLAKSDKPSPENVWQDRLSKVSNNIKALVISGVLAGDNSSTDMLIVGDNSHRILSKWAIDIEKDEGRDLNYVVMTPEELYYRLSVRDKFITDLLDNKHVVLFDSDKILNT